MCLKNVFTLRLLYVQKSVSFFSLCQLLKYLLLFQFFPFLTGRFISPAIILSPFG
jgi:hypothetical protein